MTDQEHKLLYNAAPSLLAACEAVVKAWSAKERRAAQVLCMAAITEATIPLPEPQK